MSRRPVDYSALTEKRCSMCKVTKPVSEFGTFNDSSQPINGWRYYARCRECSRTASRLYGTSDRERRNERWRRWRSENLDVALETEQRKRLRQKYDLTIEERDAMFAAQGGHCLICDQKKELSVDHDHATGQVRGGLCTGCNVILGLVEADRSRFGRYAYGEQMLTYLDRASLLHSVADSDTIVL